MTDIKFTTAGEMVATRPTVLVTATVEFALHQGLIGESINEGYILECIREALEDRITGVSEPNRSIVQSIKVNTL